jgi:hypothetical protein
VKKKKQKDCIAMIAMLMDVIATFALISVYVMGAITYII